MAKSHRMLYSCMTTAMHA